MAVRANALVVGKGIKSNQKRHETQAKPVRRRGAGGRSHYRARKNVFGGKSVASLHVALICIVWAGRTLQFALRAFYCASAPLLRDACLATGVCAACLHCCAPRRRCKAIADVHA